MSKLFPALEALTAELVAEFDQILPERKTLLGEVAGWVRGKVKAGSEAQLTFICTHNSRRSHLSQIWAQAAACYYGVPGVHCYSGGTEATACNPRTVTAMRRAGFQVICSEPRKENPIYFVQFAENVSSIHAYSKAYSEEPNPQEEFAAIMTCSHADENCPLVLGAEQRFPVRYSDPKVSDDSPDEAATYYVRLRQIGREMLYLFSLV